MNLLCKYVETESSISKHENNRLAVSEFDDQLFLERRFLLMNFEAYMRANVEIIYSFKVTNVLTTLSTILQRYLISTERSTVTQLVWCST